MRLFILTRLSLACIIASTMLLADASAQQKKASPAQKKSPAQFKSAPAPQKEAGAKGAASTQSALEIVPQGALGFGIIRNISELDAKIGGLAKDLQIAAPGALATIRALSGVQEGLEDKGSVVVAIVSGEGGDQPVAVVYVPVTDYKKFVTQLRAADANAEQTEVVVAGQDFAVTKKGNYAALTATRNADRLKEVAAAKSGSIRLAAGLTQWTGDHDAFLVFMPEAIKRGIGPVREGLQQAKAAFPADNEQLQNVGAIFDVYDKLFATIEKEITHFAVGLRIDQGNIYLNSHSVFIADGSLAQAAKDVKRPAQSGLASLPAGSYIMAFDGTFPEAWFKGMASFSAQAMRMMTPPGGEKLSDDDIKKITQSMQKSMAGVQSMAMRIGQLQPGKSMYANMSGAMRVTNSREFLASYEASIREMSKAFEKSGNPIFKSYEISKADIGGVQTLQVSMEFSGMLQAAGDPNAQKVIELMLGPEGKLTAYIAPADANTVVIAYSKEALAETLETAKKKSESLATQPEIGQTVKLLPKDSQWTVFINPKGVVEFASTIVANFAPGGPGRLPPFADTSPVGFGARMTEQGCETSLVIPKDVLAGIGSYAKMMQQNFGAGRQPGVNGVPQQKLERR